MKQAPLSNQQIIALAAVFAICVSSLLLLAPSRPVEDVIAADVARSDLPADVTNSGFQDIRTSDEAVGATGQVYALDRPSSGVLVTLGTARVEDTISQGRIKKVAPRPDKQQADVPVAIAPSVEITKAEPSPAVEPVEMVTVTPEPAPLEAPVIAAAPESGADDELIDTAILLGQMTSSVVTEPRVYTVVAGDSLASIATRFYGDPEDAVRIFEANRATLRAPESISVGQVLVLP